MYVDPLSQIAPGVPLCSAMPHLHNPTASCSALAITRAEHRKLLINGVPLLGHEGIDLAAPPGAPVHAVQDGTVLRTEQNHPRYGRLVLLGHEWGQSLYAQLGQVAVQPGAALKGGQAIGAAADPHLHFGLRIRPFAVDDGWVGHSDPAPYLDRLTQGRGAIMGPHIIGGVSPHLELLRRWQPRLITVLDPNPDEMALLRAACPARRHCWAYLCA